MRDTTLKTLTIVVFIPLLLICLSFLLSCKQSDMFEWHLKVGAFSVLDESGVEYAVQLPAKFGYKSILIIMPPNNSLDLKASIELTITNINEDFVHIVAPNFFTGKLPKGDTAIIFKGKIEEIIEFYDKNQPPSISNSRDDTTILLKIKTSKKINFKEPVVINMEASDYP